MSTEDLDAISAAVKTRVKLTRFARGILTRTDLGAAELQKLVNFFEGADDVAARRCRAMLLRRLGYEPGTVHQLVDIAQRNYFRWCRWFDEKGVSGLLRSRSPFYRQCSGCDCLGAALVDFTARMAICKPCDAERARAYRRSKKGARTCRRYEKSKKGRGRARGRFLKSDKGRAYRSRQHKARMIREVNGE